MTPGFIFLMDGGQDGSQWFFLLEAYAALGSGKRTESWGSLLSQNVVFMIMIMIMRIHLGNWRRS